MRGLVFACSVLLAACSGSDSGTDTPNPPNTPAAVVATSSTSQTGSVGQAAAARPSVKVTSALGIGVAGVTVTFAVTADGGSVTGASVATDASGTATVGSWTLGAVAGTNTLSAAVQGLTPVVFTATTTTPLPDLTISPLVAAASVNSNVAFTPSDPVTWRVNGVVGGNATTGTIAANGAYTAPTKIPDGDSVVVTATLVANANVQRSATIYFVPDLTTKDYYVALPRVVDVSAPTRTRFLLVPPASAATVTFIPNAGGSVPLTAIGNGVFTFTLEGASAVAGYTTGSLHNPVGKFDYRDASNTQVKLTNLSVNVRDATMPGVTITSLASDAQRSPFVLNIRLDTVTVNPNAAMGARALQLLGGDQYDFLAFIATVTSNNNRNYVGLRNDITGIGGTTFNNSAAWGGTGKLRGAIAFPIDGLFDGAEQGFMHEVGHSWINYATTDAALLPGPHWPLSTMAYGTMGFNIAGSNVGGNFPFTLTAIGGGIVRVNTAPQSDRFTPLDLYLMGLIPPEEVPAQFILPSSTSFNGLVDGQTFPATTYTIQNYIANQGPRVPSSVNAPKSFSLATIVLSYGRLLTATEMAFFDRAAARAETTTPLQSMNGLVLVTASGFSTATGGRATMRTRLQ